MCMAIALLSMLGAATVNAGSYRLLQSGGSLTVSVCPPTLGSAASVIVDVSGLGSQDSYAGLQALLFVSADPQTTLWKDRTWPQGYNAPAPGGHTFFGTVVFDQWAWLPTEVNGRQSD